MIRLRAAPAKPDASWLSRQHLYTLCWEGRMPADALSTADRGRLVSGLWEHGWTDVEIAAHTRMSTYTTARIREGLGLPANCPQAGLRPSAGLLHARPNVHTERGA